jgi:hypothetical protein
MQTPTIDWAGLSIVCSSEAETINRILDQYDIKLVQLMQAVAGDLDWYEVVDLRDCHLPIREHEEARLEDEIIGMLQTGWRSLVNAFESATVVDGSGLRFTEEDIRFRETSYGEPDEFWIVIHNFYTITPAGRKYEGLIRLV